MLLSCAYSWSLVSCTHLWHSRRWRCWALSAHSSCEINPLGLQKNCSQTPSNAWSKTAVHFSTLLVSESLSTFPFFIIKQPQLARKTFSKTQQLFPDILPFCQKDALFRFWKTRSIFPIIMTCWIKSVLLPCSFLTIHLICTLAYKKNPVHWSIIAGTSEIKPTMRQIIGAEQ